MRRATLRRLLPVMLPITAIRTLKSGHRPMEVRGQGACLTMDIVGGPRFGF